MIWNGYNVIVEEQELIICGQMSKFQDTFVSERCTDRLRDRLSLKKDFVVRYFSAVSHLLPSLYSGSS